jgi:hypothetical protein
MRTDGGQEGGKFSNRSQTMTIEVYLKFELAVFRFKHIFPLPVCMAKKLGDFL